MTATIEAIQPAHDHLAAMTLQDLLAAREEAQKSSVEALAIARSTQHVRTRAAYFRIGREDGVLAAVLSAEIQARGDVNAPE